MASLIVLAVVTATLASCGQTKKPVAPVVTVSDFKVALGQFPDPAAR